jgi:hypothetical protein
MELKLENSNGVALWTGSGDLVQVPMDPDERAQCRKALLNALDLLDQTIVKWSTFSTGGEMGECVTQSSPHPDGCLAVYDCSPPSEPQVSSPSRHLRIVSSDLL